MYFRFEKRKLVFIALLIFSISFTFSRGKRKFFGPIPLVKVSKVIVKDVNPPIEYVGHVEAIQEVNLMARVVGYLEQVNFKEGDFVKKGELLYVIEDAPYKAQVEAYKAAIVEAKAALLKITKKLKRLKSVKRGGVPITKIEDAEADKLKAEGTLKEMKAKLEAAKINLGYTKIYAPISGRIGKTFYTEGNLVGPNSGPLAKIVQVNPIRVVYSVNENNLLLIKKALKDSKHKKRENPILKTKIILPDGKPYKYVGHIEFVDNVVDPETSTIAIRSIFKNPSGLLIPGMYVRVLLKATKPKLMPLVPHSAVQLDNKGYFVFVVGEGNIVKPRRIEVGKTFGTYFIVKSGLYGGETVVTEGVQKIIPGEAVKIIPEKKGKKR